MKASECEFCSLINLNKFGSGYHTIILTKELIINFKEQVKHKSLSLDHKLLKGRSCSMSLKYIKQQTKTLNLVELTF